MTTIAYDGRSIAADKLESFGHGERCPLPVQKILRCSIPKHLGTVPAGAPIERHAQPRQRVLVAFSGSMCEARMLLIHYCDATRVLGQPIANIPDNSGNLLVVHLDGDPYAVIVGSKGGITTVTGELMTAGSGGEFAMGAMLAGRSAHQAVEIAALRDVYTGNGVDSFLIDAVKAEPIENFPFYLD